MLGALLGPNLAYPAVSEDADLLRDMSVANLLVESLIQHYGKLFGDGSAACLSDCTCIRPIVLVFQLLTLMFVVCDVA
jgi:hypothetical protein